MRAVINHILMSESLPGVNRGASMCNGVTEMTGSIRLDIGISVTHIANGFRHDRHVPVSSYQSVAGILNERGRG